MGSRVGATWVSWLFVGLMTAAAIRGAAGAEPGRWEPIGPEGGRIRALAVLPDGSGTVLAGTTGAGVFRSLDGGTTWQASSVGITAVEAAGLFVDPHDSRRIFYGTYDDGLFRSTDDGRTWHRADAGMQARPGLRNAIMSLAADPTVPETFYAGSRSGVYKSTDGGDTWSWLPLIEETNAVMAIAVNPADSNEVFASLWDTGVYRSGDGGATWAPVAPAHPGHVYADDLVFSSRLPGVLYANAQNHGIFATSDHGATWTPLNGDLADLYLTAFAVSAEGGLDVLTVGGRHGVFRSGDQGRHWQQLGGATLADTIGALAIDPDDPRRLYAGTWEHGVFASADGGATWARSLVGMFNSRTQIAFADPTGSGTVFAATPERLWVRPPAGDEWSFINGMGVLWSVAAAPTGVIYVGGVLGVLHRSRDAGRTWEAATDGIPIGEGTQRIRELDLDRRDPERVWARASTGLYRTANGGVLWQPVDTGYGASLGGVAVSPHRTGHVVRTGSTGGWDPLPVVLVSWDDGLTWLESNLEENVWFSDLTFMDSGADVLLAGSNAGVYRSVDGGMTWFRANTGDPHECGWGPFSSWWDCTDATSSLVADPANANVVYGLRGGRIWHSTDGATSWSPFDSELPPATINHLSIAPDGRRLYAATDGAGVWTAEVEPFVHPGAASSPRRILRTGH